MFVKKIVYLPNIMYMSVGMQRRVIRLVLAAMAVVVTTVAEAQITTTDNRLKDIEQMLELRRWGEARASLDRLSAEIDPVVNLYDKEWVEYSRVRCAVELDMSDAEEMMIYFIENYTSSIYRNDVRFMLAQYYCDDNDFVRAEREFAEVDYKALDKRNRERYDIRMGYIYFLQKDYLMAIQHFSKIAKSSEYYPHALYYRSYIRYYNGENSVAREGFRQLTDNDTYRYLIPFYLLQIEYREGNYDYVIAEGAKLLDVASETTRPDLERIIAESYFVKGDYANAIRYISEYPATLMGRQENYILGYSLYRMARYKEAIAPLAKVCGANDALTQNAAFHLGDCYLRIKDKEHAADAFAMAAVDGFNDNISEEALLNYGRLKFELGGGRFNEAVNVLQSYLQRYPGTKHESEVKALLIAAYYNSKDYDAAYAAIKEYPNPDSEIRAAQQKVAVLRAVKAVDRGDLATAEKLLKEAEKISLVPKYNALQLYWMGEVAYAQGDMERAVECYEAYMRRAPKSAKEYNFAHYGVGYAHFNRGEMDAAAASFNEFVRGYTNRDNYLYDAQNRLGDARFALRDFANARKAYKVVEQSASELRHYAGYQMAMVDGIDQRAEDKIERLKAIVAEKEGGYVDDAWYELGRSYIAQEQYKQGAATLQDFVDNDSSSPYYIAALSDLALAYYNIGKKSEARSCYERVVAYDPQSSAALEAMRGIREIYVSEGRVDDYFAYAECSGVQSDMSVAARDSLSFAVAKNLYLEGDMASASRHLKNYLEGFENGYNRTEALFYLSDCHVAAGDNDSALKSMEELLSHGRTQYTERVLDVYARMSFDMARYDKSAWAYLELYEVAYEKPKRAMASEGYVDAVLEWGDAAMLGSMADNVLAMEDATTWAKRQATLIKANILMAAGGIAEATPLYGRLAEDRMTEEGAEAYYHLVEITYNEDRYADAENMVYDMGACGSMYWQAKCFLLLGDIMVKMNNTFQARATYQSIVDGYSVKDDGIIEEAHRRIAQLPKE